MKKLVVIVGPPAVGKMTVGYALEQRTGLRLFHNHMTIELGLRFFPWGSPPFRRLVGEFRRMIFEEVAASSLPGLIFTYVWDFADPRELEFIDELCNLFQARGAEVCFVELVASQEERLRRNETEFRLREKPSKRDVAWSRENLLESDRRYRLNSAGDFPYPERYLRIDNTHLSPDEVAERIAFFFGMEQGA